MNQDMTRHETRVYSNETNGMRKQTKTTVQVMRDGHDDQRHLRITSI